jgi:hypothetical protein
MLELVAAVAENISAHSAFEQMRWCSCSKPAAGRQEIRGASTLRPPNQVVATETYKISKQAIAPSSIRFSTQVVDGEGHDIVWLDFKPASLARLSAVAPYPLGAHADTPETATDRVDRQTRKKKI